MDKHIIFISDVHLGSNDSSGVYGHSPNITLEEDLKVNKLDLLKVALQERYKQKKIDLLVFLGDYVTGKDDDYEKDVSFSSFCEFLKEIEKSKDLFRDPDHIDDYIVIVPGNHDVERNSKEPLKKFQQSFRNYITPFREPSCGVCELGAPIFIYKEQKLLLACISTVNHSSTETADISQLVEIAKNSISCDEDRNKMVNYLESQKVKDIPAIDATTTNTFIEMSRSLLDEYKNYNKIVVSHHPMIGGIERNNVIKEFSNTIGGYKFQSIAASQGYTYFFNGHIHDFSFFELHDHAEDPSVQSFHISVPEFCFGNSGSEFQVVELTLSDTRSDSLRLLQTSLLTQTFKERRLMLPGNTESTIVGTNSILVDFEIEQLIKEATIIQNADSSRIEAASYDCALGTSYKRAKKSTYDWEDAVLKPSKNNDAASIVLCPGETILIYTEEEFNIPTDMVLHASPISSWARKGLRVEISYFVDPGFKGPFCFPVTNLTDKKISISSTDPIMSVEFVKLSKSAKTAWKDKHIDKYEDRDKKADK